MQRIVVVGASLGGLRAAEAVRGVGFTGEVVVIGDEAHLPYNRPPLSKEALAGEAVIEAAGLEFRRRKSVDDVRWVLGNGASACDLAARQVTLADGEVLDFDGLVAASGLRVRRLSMPAPEGGRHAVRTIEDGDSIRVWNALGEVHCLATITPRIARGTVSLPKGLWRKSTFNQSTANALAPDSLTDIGGGACFNDARVEVTRMVSAAFGDAALSLFVVPPDGSTTH